MSRAHQIEKHRGEVAKRSEYQCGLTHPTEGRCARSCRSEDHHIQRRGEGGVDEPKNRVLICPEHHGQIHGQRTPYLYRVEHGGCVLYVEDVNAEGHEYVDIVSASAAEDAPVADVVQLFADRGMPVYELWPDVSDEWHERAKRAHDNLVALKAEELDRTWDVGENAKVILTGNLYSLFGFDTFDEFANDLDYKPGTLKRYALAVERMHSVVSEGETEGGEDKRDLARQIKISVWHQKGRALIELGEEKVLDLARQVRDHGLRSTSILETIDEEDPVAEAEQGPRWNVDIYASNVKFTIRPRGKTKKEAEDNAQRSLSRYRSLADCTIDRVVARGKIDEREDES